MNRIIIALRWLIACAALRLARVAAVKNCDYGNRVCAAVDGFFFYTAHGDMPPRDDH